MNLPAASRLPLCPFPCINVHTQSLHLEIVFTVGFHFKMKFKCVKYLCGWGFIGGNRPVNGCWHQTRGIREEGTLCCIGVEGRVRNVWGAWLARFLGRESSLCKGMEVYATPAFRAGRAVWHVGAGSQGEDVVEELGRDPAIKGIKKIIHTKGRRCIGTSMWCFSIVIVIAGSEDDPELNLPMMGCLGSKCW